MIAQARFHSSARLLFPRLAAFASILLLAGCASTVRFQEIKKIPTPWIASGQKLTHADELDAVLAKAESAATEMQAGNATSEALYNACTARVVELLQQNGQPLLPGRQAVEVGSGYRVGFTSVSRQFPQAALFDEFLATDRFRVSGLSATVVRPGVGATLVAYRKGTEERRKTDPFLRRHGQATSATAILRFGGMSAGRRAVSLELIDSREYSTVRIAGVSRPLAGNFSAPIARLANSYSTQALAIPGLTRPDIGIKNAHVRLSQPHTPGRVPIIFIHGLLSYASTWEPMTLALLADPDIRKRCEFWYFSYPTGIPSWYSTELLRKDLDVARERFGVGPQVAIGHSMGGLLTRRLTIQEPDRFWREVKAKSQFRDVPDSRLTAVKSTFMRPPEPDLKMAIYIATPHQGSNLALMQPARLLGRIVRLPVSFLKLTGETLVEAVEFLGAKNTAQISKPTSLDSLSPRNPERLVFASYPLNPKVEVHSIIGTRNAKRGPGSSDGIVPYWSSHLDGAKSELLVSSGHGAHVRAESSAEVRSILREYLGLKPE